ncbi:SLATT domain-containing protein [Desulfovibrio sp. ZJ369]|uniref:SLATT domain-containing protein n=1 Tax=Desulfovibrio sp. ZJ369 TaxID=2709793 RepID=UPI0013EBF7D2|nr:SLATT domain-containing protein [Desulfovibrio sp. ZJ369]
MKLAKRPGRAKPCPPRASAVGGCAALRMTTAETGAGEIYLRRCALARAFQKQYVLGYIMKDMKKLSNTAYITAKSRLNASNRLQRKQKSFVFFIILMTIVQIGMSSYILITQNSNHINLFSCIVITLSVFIALISNSESLSNDTLNSYKFHECGMKLLALSRKIDNHIENDLENLNIDDLQNIYDNIISQCGVNHINIDYKLAKATIEDKYITFYKVCHFCSALCSIFLYSLIVSVIFYVYYIKI